MAVRTILLSGAAAFALGVLGVGVLFEKPGGDKGHRRLHPVADVSATWGEWEPMPPEATAGMAPATAAAVTAPEAPEEEEAAAPDAPPLPHVWATPAEWSEVE